MLVIFAYLEKTEAPVTQHEGRRKDKMSILESVQDLLQTVPEQVMDAARVLCIRRRTLGLAQDFPGAIEQAARALRVRDTLEAHEISQMAADLKSGFREWVANV